MEWPFIWMKMFYHGTNRRKTPLQGSSKSRRMGIR